MIKRIRHILDHMEERPFIDFDDGLFRWATHDGDYVRPDQMDTLHLFHVVRLLWNHTVPKAQQLTPFRQWNLTLDTDERDEAMTEMLAELSRRMDKTSLTAAQRGELSVIRLKDKVWAKALNALARDELDGYCPGDRNRWDPFDTIEEEDFRDGCPNT